MSFMLHVVWCQIVLYLYNTYTESNLKFLTTYFMCMLYEAELCVNKYVYFYMAIMCYTV